MFAPFILGALVFAFRQGMLVRQPVRSIVRPAALSALAGVGISRPRDTVLRVIFFTHTLQGHI